MSTDPATTAFAAFCKTGNPEQLGVVFDRLAPELLLVAARLLAPGGDPSDVVQQTFMTALQQRHRYQQGRPVAPWLVGILLQHVRRERRRLRRRLDSRRLREGAAEDPAIVAATRDHAEAVRRAVTALPQPYRQVLQLHLIHGLPANAVATSLELPFRTVQSQLRRGLHQLRKKLPRLAVAPWTGRALELVRADVLRAASSFCGWLLLPVLKVAGLLALVPVCVLTAASMSTGGSTVPPSLEVVPVVSAARASHELRDLDLAGVQSERELLQDPQPVCRVRLQLLRVEDEAPVVGAQVTARVWDKDAGGRLRAAGEAGAVVSDARGEAVIELPRANQRTAWIRIEAAGRIAICKWLPVPDRDQIAFEGLGLLQAVPGRIRVRDQHGGPVPSLEVAVRDRMQHGFQREQQIRGRTDAEGWTPGLLLPAGDTQVTCKRVPIAFAQGEEVSVPLSVRGGDHEVTLQRPDPKACIGGQLIGQDGEPMRGWVVLLRARDGAVLTANMGRLPTDAEGRFLLPVPDGEAGPFRIRGGIGQQNGQAGDATWERGVTDAQVRLRFPDGLALTVVDARTGEPVEDFGVVCLRVHAEQHGMITGDSDLRCAGRHPGGALFLEGVEGGENRLLVLPAADDPCLPSGYLPVSIAHRGVTRLTVKLQRPAPVRVRVTFGDGKPMAGSRVRLRARLSDKNDTAIRHVANKSGFHSTAWWGRLDLAMAVTDGNGIAEVPWQPWHEPVIVRADGPGHVVCERELPGVDVNGELIELRVGRGALLRGTVTSIGSWPALAVDSTSKPLEVPFDRMRPCVVLRNCADGALMKDCEGEAFPVQADGRFECPDVPPGRWQVLFQYNRHEGHPGSMRITLHRALVEVVTMPGKEHAVTFDLAECLPASVWGRIFLGGEQRAASQLTLDSYGRDHQGRPVSNLCYASEHFVRADGTYAAGVLAGDVELEAVIDGKTYRLFERVPVAPGEHKQFDLQFRHLVARVRLVRDDGTPVGNRLVRVDHDFMTSSADGWLTFDPVRPLRFDVEMFGPGIDRDGLRRMRYDDPRTRPVAVGSVTLDPAKALSEHQLTVREP